MHFRPEHLQRLVDSLRTSLVGERMGPSTWERTWQPYAEECVYVVSDRLSACNHLLLEQRQLCWAHLSRVLTAMAERPGASGEIRMELVALPQKLFERWHEWKDARIDWLQLQQSCLPIRLEFETTLQRVVDLGCERGE